MVNGTAKCCAPALTINNKDFVEVRCTVCGKIHRIHPSKVR